MLKFKKETNKFKKQIENGSKKMFKKEKREFPCCTYFENIHHK